MVLKSAKAALLGTALVLPFAAQAQQLGTTAPIIDLPTGYDEQLGAEMGPFTVYTSAEARAEYDSNIYAENSGSNSDLVLITAPRVEARTRNGPTQVTLRAQAQARTYAEYSTEDALSALAGAYLVTGMDSPDVIRADVSWQRAIEDRGDPEARNFIGSGPRRFDVLGAQAGWTHQGPRILLGAEGSIRKIDYLSALDNERDLTIYSGQVTAGYTVSGAVRAVVVGFANQRTFRLDEDTNGINRDATTYGARAGLRFDEGGILRGEATVGLFELDPKDPTLPKNSGVSVQANVSYLPTRRIALFMEAFRGDVATVRNGAQSRTDTNFVFGVQAEARRNLRLQASVNYRQTKYVGTSVKETTKGVRGEIEYRLTPNLSLALSARYSTRDSDLITEEFNRLRTGLELRVKL
ncbi:hypothetical protein FHS61_000610 [Altererythrobacter atlanticus]|uniref:Uncharacterized protein n=1 Tax=Croceibacterium atlanticum TaxID=1267766 RepID=A0A0F7KU84_9SPHN|nr:outer membrane beta-barrel protein [Croceibacterium atlanticum]AKH42837.1 hypothetical protein WYH_01801 [Croceibacterium atlanticum]MBB5731617.1 hypothetical protein [Croceibacterium atlanticum]